MHLDFYVPRLLGARGKKIKKKIFFFTKSFFSRKTFFTKTSFFPKNIFFYKKTFSIEFLLNKILFFY